MSAVVAAILVAGLALAAAARAGSSAAIEHNNRGNDLLKEHRWEEAITELDKAIELDPNLATAYNNRGRAYSELGQYDRALDEYGTAVQLDPTDAVAFYNRGATYSELEQYEQAVADYDKAIELDLEDSAVYLQRGFAYLRLELYEQAVADYDKAIELDPGHALAYANRGSAYRHLDQKAQAKADYEKAKSLSSDPTLTAQVQESLDRLAGTWPSEWEDLVCGAFAAVHDLSEAGRSASEKAKACAKAGGADDCLNGAVGFEAAAKHADAAIRLLEAAPSWPPGQPWVDNLMTQAVGYRDSDRLLAASLEAAADGDTASLLAAYVGGSVALKQPTYIAARKATDSMKQVFNDLYEETGFVCPD